MLAGLEGVTGGTSVLPFVHLFCGRPSTYLWEDDCGTVHTINQGEGGEQGDPLMPLLFAVGQHPLWPHKRDWEPTNGFSHTLTFTSSPGLREGAVYAVLEDGVECCRD